MFSVVLALVQKRFGRLENCFFPSNNWNKKQTKLWSYATIELCSHMQELLHFIQIEITSVKVYVASAYPRTTIRMLAEVLLSKFLLRFLAFDFRMHFAAISELFTNKSRLVDIYREKTLKGAIAEVFV